MKSRLLQNASRCRVAAVLAGLAFGFAVPSALEAHSFDRGFASARHVAHLEGDELWLLVVVEMPTLDVMGDFRRFLRDHPEASDEENTERFRRQQLGDVAAALELLLGGEVVDDAWRPVDNPANGLGDTDFFVYMLEHRRPVSAGRLELELENRLQPAKVVYLSTSVEVEDSWRVIEDSSAPLLADGLDGEIVGPDVGEEASGKWGTEEALRSWRVVFEKGGPESAAP